MLVVLLLNCDKLIIFGYTNNPFKTGFSIKNCIVSIQTLMTQIENNICLVEKLASKIIRVRDKSITYQIWYRFEA